MKKKLSYRDKLLELSKIYNVKEIQEYIKKGKNLTSGQIELILRKNKIVIPKDFNTNFFRENITKPLSRVTKQIDNLDDCFVNLWYSEGCNNRECSCNCNWFRSYTFSSRKEKNSFTYISDCN